MALMEWTQKNGKSLEARIGSLTRTRAKAQERLQFHQKVRLSWAGLYGAALVISALFRDLGLPLPATLVFLPVFIYLVARTRRIKAHTERLARWDQLLRRQLARTKGRPLSRPAPDLKAYEGQTIAFDLGLFGELSLWNLLDETLTEGGQAELLKSILSEPQDADAIRNRQKELARLKSETWFYQKLVLYGPEANSEISTSAIRTFLSKSFIPPWMGLAISGLIGLWVLCVAMTIAAANVETLASFVVPLWTAFAFANLGVLFRAGSAFKHGIGLSHHLSELAPVFGLIEKRVGKSEIVRELCPTISLEGPSRQVSKLNRILGFLGVETNPLLHLILNAVTPWSTTATYALERRRLKIANSFPTCLMELNQLEALGSLLLFQRHQTSVFPQIETASKKPVLQFKNLFHPLIDRTRVVANDFSFTGDKMLGLLTGSNMSGKSTFLRTVGLNQMLANMGAPVFADSLTTSPLKVETCIEVSDSLRDGFSYFYAEVRRLKYVLDQAKSGAPVLYLIDEIFRGTNNRERQIGSRSVIRSLARAPHAMGFVSTHDLELTSLENEERAVLNLHFKEDMAGNEMLFSYRLNQGPSPTTNALKIMEISGIELDV